MTSLDFSVPRIRCRQGNKTRQVKIGFAGPRVTYTRSFERYALDLLPCMTIQDVAEHLSISWDVIKEIQKRHLARRFAKPKPKHLRWLASDEISIAKGHRYVTIMMDLHSGAVVFVGDGKGAESLEPFWQRLRASHAKIEAVATDMPAADIDAVTTHLPHATLVFDRFHVIKLYHDKLMTLRREWHRQLEGTLKKIRSKASDGGLKTWTHRIASQSVWRKLFDSMSHEPSRTTPKTNSTRFGSRTTKQLPKLC